MSIYQKDRYNKLLVNRIKMYMDVTSNHQKTLTISAAFLWMCALVSNANNVTVFLAGGPDFSTLKNQQLVQMNALVTNAYLPKKHSAQKGFIGIGVAHTLAQPWLPSMQWSLGLAEYFLSLGQVSGIEFPFINDGLYDSLNYKFHAKSTTAMLESRWVYSTPSWQPFVMAGIGTSWNRFSEYEEMPTNPALSAASLSLGFEDHTQSSFAYEFGIGIQHSLWQDNVHHIEGKASLGYQYFNLGQGRLGSSPLQSSPERLRVNHIYTQALVLSLSMAFN